MKNVVLLFEEVKYQDGRMFELGSLSWPDEPIPIVRYLHMDEIVGYATNIRRMGSTIVADLDVDMDRAEISIFVNGILAVAEEDEFRIKRATLRLITYLREFEVARNTPPIMTQ